MMRYKDEPQQDILVSLRAENERLKAIVAEQEGWSAKKDARIAGLKTALKPFADYRFPEGEILRTSDRFHPMTVGTGELTVGDFRRAAAAQKETDD